MSTEQSVPELLATALHQHRQGNLDAAAAVYRQILSHQPEQPDVLHLLGVLNHQQGDQGQAVELIRSAIRLRPDEPAYYVNLAEVHRALGQLEDAVACCQRALALEPDSAAAANNLGLALMGQQKLDEARSAFESALRCQPDFPDAHNNLANTLRLLGQTHDAIAAFRQALALRPNMPEAHSNLGQLLNEVGKPEEALEHCREAEQLAPQLAAVQCNLGNVLRKLGRLEEAKQHYSQAIALQPELAMAYNNVGRLLEEEGLVDDAVGWYQQALQRDPHSADAQTSLARASVEQRDFDAAAARYRAVLQLHPQHAEAHDGLGTVLREQGKPGEAVAHIREAIRLKPTLAAAHANLGHCLIRLDRTDEAAASFREALRNDPFYANAHAGLAATLGADITTDETAAIERLIDRQLVSPRKLAELHFALANARDAQGRFDEAAEHARQANATRHRIDVQQKRDYDPDEHTRMVDRLIDTFTTDFFERTSGWGSNSPLPVFHVGLPRSGKTMAEQVLAAHPSVFGAGELSLGSDSFESFPELLGLQVEAVECVPRWTSQSVAEVAARHLAQLRSLDGDAERIVDTMPHNYLRIGMIVTLFPNARIVHCRRNLRDSALACWMKSFKRLSWAFDVGQLAARIGEYRQLMQHWRRVLPGKIFELDYEQMVSEPERAARRLVEFVGLDWHPACEAFLEQNQLASAVHFGEAKPPFTSQFIGRWKNYRATLQSLWDQVPED